MSVVVYDGVSMAADKLNFDYNGPTAKVTKIRVINGHLVGYVGKTLVAGQMFKWFENGCIKEDYPMAQQDVEKCGRMMVVTPDGKIMMYESSPDPWENEQLFCAIGSGSDLATGAMAAGAGATKAVQIAIDHCVVCGLGIDVITFPKQ